MRSRCRGSAGSARVTQHQPQLLRRVLDQGRDARQHATARRSGGSRRGRGPQGAGAARCRPRCAGGRGLAPQPWRELGDGVAGRDVGRPRSAATTQVQNVRGSLSLASRETQATGPPGPAVGPGRRGQGLAPPGAGADEGQRAAWCPGPAAGRGGARDVARGHCAGAPAWQRARPGESSVGARNCSPSAQQLPCPPVAPWHGTWTGSGPSASATHASQHATPDASRRAPSGLPATGEVIGRLRRSVVGHPSERRSAVCRPRRSRSMCEVR